MKRIRIALWTFVAVILAAIIATAFAFGWTKRGPGNWETSPVSSGWSMFESGVVRLSREDKWDPEDEKTYFDRRLVITGRQGRLVENDEVKPEQYQDFDELFRAAQRQ